MPNLTRRQFTGLALSLPLVSYGLSETPLMAANSLFDIGAYRGKVVYLDFWASWCGPCKLSFPFMKSLRGKYPSSEFSVVTVNVDRKRALADKFLQQVGGGLPVIYDSAGSLAKKYGVKDMPTSFLFDKNGRLRFTHAGFHSNQTSQYFAHINQLIKE